MDTFHAAALKQLRYFWPKAVGSSPPELISRKAPMVGAALRQFDLSNSKGMVKDTSAHIEWAKTSGFTADDLALELQQRGRELPEGINVNEFVQVYTAYQENMANAGQMDFEDVLLLTLSVLADRPELAAEVHQRYRWFTVDEYQDVSPVQQALLDLWLGDRDELCVVGDAGQTIYSFAGATSQYLETFKARYPHAASCDLVQSYRVPAPVATAATRLLGATRGARSHPPLQLIGRQVSEAARPERDRLGRRRSRSIRHRPLHPRTDPGGCGGREHRGVGPYERQTPAAGERPSRC